MTDDTAPPALETDVADVAELAPPVTYSEDCLPLPAPFPDCARCGNPLTLSVTPWPSGGMLLRWLCFDRGSPQSPEDWIPCHKAPLRDGPIPGLVPHPESRVLVTRTELMRWYAEIDAAAADILSATRASRRQALKRTEPAIRRIGRVLDELSPRIDPEQTPAQVHAVAPALAVVPEPHDDDLDDDGPPAGPAPDPCPVCAATADKPCVTSSGARAKRPHAGRA